MMKNMFGENPKESGSIARIVNKHHFLRLMSLLEDPLVKASIVYGGSMDEDSLYSLSLSLLYLLCGFLL